MDYPLIAIAMRNEMYFSGGFSPAISLYHNLAVAEGQVRLLVKIRNGRIFFW